MKIRYVCRPIDRHITQNMSCQECRRGSKKLFHVLEYRSIKKDHRITHEEEEDDVDDYLVDPRWTISNYLIMHQECAKRYADRRYSLPYNSTTNIEFIL